MTRIREAKLAAEAGSAAETGIDQAALHYAEEASVELGVEFYAAVQVFYLAAENGSVEAGD